MNTRMFGVECELREYYRAMLSVEEGDREGSSLKEENT